MAKMVIFHGYVSHNQMVHIYIIIIWLVISNMNFLFRNIWDVNLLIDLWLVVNGTYFFPIYWEFHNPN